MVKGKVKIVSWPPVGAESVKPRFKIRGEYPVIEIGIGTAAVLDDHNQVIWMNLEMLSFIEIGGEKIQSLSEFLEANPDKSPEAKEKAERQKQANTDAETRAASEKAEREAKSAAQAEETRAKAVADENKRKAPEPEQPVAPPEPVAQAEKAEGDEPAPE